MNISHGNIFSITGSKNAFLKIYLREIENTSYYVHDKGLLAEKDPEQKL